MPLGSIAVGHTFKKCTAAPKDDAEDHGASAGGEGGYMGDASVDDFAAAPAAGGGDEWEGAGAAAAGSWETAAPVATAGAW